MDYYLKVHVPLAMERLGSAISSFSVDVGMSAPHWPAPLFATAGHYICESAEAFMAAYAPHAADLQADVANYTDVEPVIQISEVRFSTSRQS